MTVVLAVIYFLLIEALVIAHSPAGRELLFPAVKTPAVKPLALPARAEPTFNYVGEEIVYDVKMGSLKIGTAVFQHRQQAQRDGIDTQMVVFTTRVIQINDTETIWADTKEFLPLRVERDVRMWPKYERIIERRSIPWIFPRLPAASRKQNASPKQGRFTMPFCCRIRSGVSSGSRPVGP